MIWVVLGSVVLISAAIGFALLEVRADRKRSADFNARLDKVLSER